MTGPAVVFDTNTYRSLTDARFDALLSLEKRHGIAPYADPWVIMELLSHLADPRDRSSASCRQTKRDKGLSHDAQDMTPADLDRVANEINVVATDLARFIGETGQLPTS